ncbi:MAG: anthranilate phosphoribosyltransferase [Chitinophagales bacterium]|nr:anthranilate phosphoribosyltransferase [Chitinophagales bacterium]
MKEILQQLYAGEILLEEQIYQLMNQIGEGVFSDIEVAAFLSALNMRSIGVGELRGLRRAMLDLCPSIDFNGIKTIDMCGTGGDGKNTFNISTLSAFVVAGADIPVTKHGNYAVSSGCGSSNVLESLGVKFTNDKDILKKQLEKAHITILHAPLFHPSMKYVAPTRKAMRVKTVFNILGPLTNPCHPAVQVAGVYNMEVGRLYYYLLQSSAERFAVVHALDGYDEISLTGDVKVFSDKGEKCFSPSDIGLRKNHAHEIAIHGSVDDAKNIFLDIIQGGGTDAQRNVVLANAGLGISTFKNIALEEGIALAAESIDSGNAMNCLKNLFDTQ